MFKEFILENTVFKKRLFLLEEKKKLYKGITSQDEIYNYQLTKFNRTWKHCIDNIPFYQMWQKKYNLPNSIKSIDELKIFPILTKKDIQKNKDLILENLENYFLISTGGTSGITTEFPTSNYDRDITYVNAYLGRSWWGINPMDNILMFWGHSHLFGKGFKGYINQIKRKLSDFLINITRISSYSLTKNNVIDFYNEIIKVKPIGIISYSSNIFKICKYMESKNVFYNNNIIGVVLTSETVTDVDIALIEKYLNTKVINEYGMAETGVVAYSFKDTKNIKILWDNFILTANSKNELVITTINDSIFPLINYTSEDVAVIKDIYKESILSVASIEGKVRNVLSVHLNNGNTQEISTIFFDHVLKNYPNIYSVHYKQETEKIIIFLISNLKLDLFHLQEFLIKEVQKEFKNIEYRKIELVQIDSIEKTIAGKNKTFV